MIAHHALEVWETERSRGDHNHINGSLEPGEAAKAACDTTPLPEQILPSLSVSFNSFASAEFSIQAVYDMKDSCG
jgi:hypothetical protein